MVPPEKINYFKVVALIADIACLVIWKYIREKLLGKDTFETFLNKEKHKLVHVYETLQCCECMVRKIIGERLISRKQFFMLYKSVEQKNIQAHNKYARRKLTQICICKYAAIQNIDVKVVDITLANYIIQKCGQREQGIDNWIEQIKDVRNEIFHLSDIQKLTDDKFSRTWARLEGSILGIAHLVNSAYAEEIKIQILQTKNHVFIPAYMLKYEKLCCDYWRNKCSEFERAQLQEIEMKAKALHKKDPKAFSKSTDEDCQKTMKEIQNLKTIVDNINILIKVFGTSEDMQTLNDTDLVKEDIKRVHVPVFLQLDLPAAWNRSRILEYLDELRINGTSDSSIRIMAVSPDDLTIYSAIAREVLSKVDLLQDEVRKIMSGMLSEVAIDPKQIADVGVSLTIPDITEECSEMSREDEIELTENYLHMSDDQSGNLPEFNDFECKHKSKQTHDGSKFRSFDCNDLFKCMRDKWRCVEIDELRSIYAIPDFFDLYPKPISDVSQLNKGDTIMYDVQSDVISFMRSCLQQALVFVRNTDDESDKNAEQVKPILSSEETNVAGEGNIYIAKEEELGQNKKTFMSGVVAHLRAIIKEYVYQHQWLNTAEFGSFRRPVMQYIEGKVGHWLAGVLAVMDKNENFDILSEDMTKGWKSILWREIINDPQITQIRYSNFENGKKTNAKGGFVVEDISKEATHFKSKMPFSWIIYRELSSIWKIYQHIPIPDTQESKRITVLRTANAFRTMPLGKLIAQINKQDVVEAIQDYVSDFVLMIYPVKSRSEHQFVCDNVLYGCKTMVHTDLSQDILASLIGCHATFDLNEKHFRNFESIVQIWPACSIKCLEKLKEIHLLEIDEEQFQLLDLMALHLLLENLDPVSKENLNKPRGREQWIRLLCDYRPVVERILGFLRENNQGHKFSTKFTTFFRETRCLWTRATVLKLFIEHVCTDDSEVVKCMSLWNMLKTNADLKTSESFEKIKRFLKVVSSNHFSETNLAYQDFRRRCNSFAIEVVTQLCFAEGTPPSNAIVEELQYYITVQSQNSQEVTEQLTMFDNCIDSIPNARSLLLQHLMQTSLPEVQQCLEYYFNKSLETVDRTTTCTNEHSHSLIYLFLQCMEDFCHQRYPDENGEMIQAATDMLNNSCTNLRLASYMLFDNIANLSRTRFSLTVAATFMYKVFIEMTITLDSSLQRLFTAVEHVCEESGSKWPRRFFIKYLCRCYGIESYHTIRSNCDMAVNRWITLPELQDNKIEECHDRFIVCGEDYVQMRETVIRAALNEDAETITNVLETKTNDWVSEVRFLLAIFREFTMNFLYEEAQQTLSQNVKQFVQRTLMNSEKIHDKDLIRDLLTNSVWRHDVDRNISAALDLRQQGLCCLLLHSLVLFRRIPGNQTWLSPFVNIANSPELMTESYFPTMPQDDLNMIKNALLVPGFENIKFYRCPNGHLYAIGSSGWPIQLARCECGLTIGGEHYQLISGNTRDQGVDTTDTGHILGKTNYGNVVLYPERTLKIANCAIMKLLLHLAMYIGANNNTKATCESIKPDIEEADVPSYLLHHLHEDLKSLATILGRSVENILVLMHFLLAEIMNSHTQAVIDETADDDICLLKNKRSREIWEQNFDKKYIAPILEKSEEILTTVNNKIVNDKRQGSDPLLQLVYESDKPAKYLVDVDLSENPSVWQVRDRISVDHLRQSLTKSQQNCPVLQQFLDKEHFLRAVRFVPGIIKLQNMLIKKYSRRLDRAEALGLTMSKVLMEFQDTLSSEIMSCWNDFKQAWEYVQQFIEGYGFRVNGNFVFLSKENCRRRIDESTTIGYVLPSERDSGLCSYALLFFLLEKQNLFLYEYCNQRKIKYDSLPEVNVNNLTAADLISYHPGRDLLPMILANCNFSYEDVQGKKVEYNFTNLEKQIMDRFLFTKSVILLKGIETVEYRFETTNAAVFLQLRDRLPQERISVPVLKQIQIDLNQKTFQELCDSIDILDISISFLKSFDSDAESLLSDFIINILTSDEYFVSQKTHESCKCKDIQCLWMTLNLEKTKRLQNNNMGSFHSIPSAFSQKLSEDQRYALYEILNNLQIEQLDYLSKMIFDCLMLTINMPQKDEEYVDMSKVGLKDAVESYLYDPPYEYDAPKPDWLDIFVNVLPKDGDSRLLCCHVVETWVTIHKTLAHKKDQLL